MEGKNMDVALSLTKSEQLKESLDSLALAWKASIEKTAEERNRKGLELLRNEFLPNEINKLPKPTTKDGKPGVCKECKGYHILPAIHLDYVGHAALTKRLLDVDPEWFWEPMAFDSDGLPKFDEKGGLWIRLFVCGMSRIGYGDSQGKTGPNAVKEAIGDALRNSGMRYGAALDLWHKGDLYDAKAERGDEDVSERPTLETPKPEKPPVSEEDLDHAKSYIDQVQFINTIEELETLYRSETVKPYHDVMVGNHTLKSAITSRLKILRAQGTQV